jgi:TfoX/Sxy family transcriptional regulator of competence genes
MAVSQSYRSFVLEQLARVLPSVQARAMFGGVGIYSGQLFFALIDNDTLFFKVDDETRPLFAQRGMPPFRPFGDGGEVMAYHEVPADVLEDRDTLAEWAAAAVAVARRARGRRRTDPRR